MKIPGTIQRERIVGRAKRGVDLLVYAVILLIGAFQFTHYVRTSDFVSDPGYPDLAQSILERGSYQFDFLPEATLPPGFPLILAAVGRFAGLSPATLFPVLAVSTALGLLVAYELLRRVESRGLAAVACLLMGSSPSLFGVNTGLVFPEMPFFLASMLALLLALKIDSGPHGKAVIGWALVLGLVLALAVLIRSVGIALLIGLGTWIAASFLAAPETGWRRLRYFTIPLILGMTAQLGWSVWAQRHEALEWPQLPGYPQSYLSQLKVKDGQHPELGMASIADIPARIGRNIISRTVGFGEMLTRKHISPFWSSPAICGVLILIVVGLAYSLRNGGQLHDWYFLWGECIFLVWPWDFRERFLFPVLPLACLYLWRGLQALKECSRRAPKVVGLLAIVSGSILTSASAAFALHVATFPTEVNHARMDHVQPIASVLFWGVLVAIGFGLLLVPTSAFEWFNRLPWPRISISLRAVATLGALVIVASGIQVQVAYGRYNLHPDVTHQEFYPEIKAAQWIQANQPSGRVIMAREQDTVFHYTRRRVVWFPPISDPQVLMDGVRRFHVALLLVVHHSNSYWLPAEDVCFKRLLQAYGSLFRLIHQDGNYEIFEVLPSAG